MKNKLSILLLFIALATVAVAQPLPMDESVRKGVLPNGLTYYIRHNAKTPKVADFYIAQRVGSILEEPRQRGLAHFLEHMAFNGTKNFPGNGKKPGVVQWCESVGIKFGVNLNAYTSIDETVYNISAAPVIREGIIDSCLLVLHDWSHSLLLKGDEIDKERGVIHEEWRTRRAGMARSRMSEVIMPQIYRGTKYEDCMPIGTMDVVDNFPYNDLRDYYRKWYRPDLQAIIVVGDVDVDAVEGKIKKRFGSIPKVKNPAERIYYPVSDNEKIIVAKSKDKEQPTVSLTLYMKHDAPTAAEKNDYKYLQDNFRCSMVTAMINNRLKDFGAKPNSPFVSTSVRYTSFWLASTKEALVTDVACRPDNILGGLQAAVQELERARKTGFSQSELERASANYLQRATTQYNERNHRENGTLVKSCLWNFTDNEPLISREYYYEAVKKIIAETTLEQVNETCRDVISDRNQVLVVYAPDKPEVVVPTDGELVKTIEMAQSQNYEPYEDAAVGKQLIANLPEPGKIKSEKPMGKHGITVFELSNGMKVYVKPTDFDADYVKMSLLSKGGSSLYPASDTPNFAFLQRAIQGAGVGDFDALTLGKMTAGKSVSVNPYVEEYYEGISAKSSVKDFKTLCELVYLYFTSPRKDENAFAAMIDRNRSFLANRNASPKVTYNDSTTNILYGYQERLQPVTVDKLDKVDGDRILEIYKERFADASNFAAYVVGKVDIDSLRPLLEQYLASLPATYSNETCKDAGTNVRPVDETHIFFRKQETQSTLVSVYYTAKVDFSAKSDLTLDVLGQALREQYTAKVREEKGGTYGVSVSGQITDFPKDEALLKISFRTDPAKYDELIPIIYQEVENMAQNGPTEESLAKIKRYLHKKHGQSVMQNKYWEYLLYNMIMKGLDYETGYDRMVDELTVGDVRDLAHRILKQKHRIEITMTSEPKE